jgi:hypothetical protein
VNDPKHAGKGLFDANDASLIEKPALNAGVRGFFAEIAGT